MLHTTVRDVYVFSPVLIVFLGDGSPQLTQGQKMLSLVQIVYEVNFYL